MAPITTHTRDQRDDNDHPPALRDYIVHIYLDEAAHDPAHGVDGHTAVHRGWDLIDTPADFDYIGFRNAWWGAVNNQAHHEAHRDGTAPDLTGTWKITYTRTGTVHSAERLTPAGRYA